MILGATGRGSLRGAPALFVTIPLGRRLKGSKGMFFRRGNHHEEAQEEKGSQEEEPRVAPWLEGTFRLFILELVFVGTPLLLLRLINKLLARSS
jgi:hypothetical protein